MSGKKNFLPEKVNSSKENYTIGGTGCSLRNSVSAMPFPFLAFVAFGTRKGLLRYGRDTRCAKQPPVVRDAFSEALRAQNRLLGYGREIRYRKPPPTVRGAVRNTLLRYEVQFIIQRRAVPEKSDYEGCQRYGSLRRLKIEVQIPYSLTRFLNAEPKMT